MKTVSAETVIDKIYPVEYHKGSIGLELEVEGKKRLPSIASKMWLSKAEGSLRNHGIEYITRAPLYNSPYKRKHIRDLLKHLEPHREHIIPDNPRTSTHVHINVQKYTIKELVQLICAYWLFENLLVKFCGPELREGNHFCLRICEAEYIFHTLMYDATKRGDNIFLSSFLDSNNLRYSALNLAAVPRFGSVEFRAMRGTLDLGVLDQWSSELHRLCNNAKKSFASPMELMDTYFVTPLDDFIAIFFSPEFVKVLTSYRHWRELTQENEGLCAELAYAKDWSTAQHTSLVRSKKEQTVPGREPRRVRFDPALANRLVMQPRMRVRRRDEPQEVRQVQAFAGNWDVDLAMAEVRLAADPEVEF